MSGLLYREDMDEVRTRMRAFWDGDGIGRPALHIVTKREKPLIPIPYMPVPEGWLTDYSTSNFDYRVYLARTTCNNLHYLGEAVPNVSPDLGPNCLALYLGCRGIDMPCTVWFEPCIESPETALFEYDPENYYWAYTLRLAREQLEAGQGRFMIQYPDLIEGLDTLAAMRGAQELMMDLFERPDWVHACLRKITDLYFRYYDVLYDMFRDEGGGSYFWAWAPGRMVKLQSDFSAMIGPEMFGEFMVPVLNEMCERISYSMYHWDGPGALLHLDHLLSIPKLDMIQWTPGAGRNAPDHPEWWPYYHRILEAGKKVFVHTCTSIESLRAMRREFGNRLDQFLIGISIPSPDQVDEILCIASGSDKG